MKGPKVCIQCGTIEAARWRKQRCPACYDKHRAEKHDAPKCEVCGEGPIWARGRCLNHYRELQRRMRGVAPRRQYPSTCSVERCEEPHHAKGFCVKHYQKDHDRRRRESAKLQDYDPGHRRIPKPPRGDPRGHWEEGPNVTVVHWVPRKATLPWTCPHCNETFEEVVPS